MGSDEIGVLNITNCVIHMIHMIDKDDGLWLYVTFGFNVTVPILVKQLKGFLVFLNHVFCQIIGHVVVYDGLSVMYSLS